VVLALLVVLLRARIISLASGTPRNRGQLSPARLRPPGARVPAGPGGAGGCGAGGAGGENGADHAGPGGEDLDDPEALRKIRVAEFLHPAGMPPLPSPPPVHPSPNPPVSSAKSPPLRHPSQRIFRNNYRKH
jgi:hypothetical protein